MVEKVLEERGSKYGPFARHASATQNLKRVMKDAYNGSHECSYDELDPVLREALDMIAHKLGRIVNGDSYYDDSWVDIAGYAQLVVDHLAEEKTKVKDITYKVDENEY